MGHDRLFLFFTEVYTSSWLQGKAKKTPSHYIMMPHNKSYNIVLSDRIRFRYMQKICSLIHKGVTEGVSQPLSTRLLQLRLTDRNFCGLAELLYFLLEIGCHSGRRQQMVLSMNRRQWQKSRKRFLLFVSVAIICANKQNRISVLLAFLTEKLVQP